MGCAGREWNASDVVSGCLGVRLWPPTELVYFVRRQDRIYHHCGSCLSFILCFVFAFIYSYLFLLVFFCISYFLRFSPSLIPSQILS